MAKKKKKPEPRVILSVDVTDVADDLDKIAATDPFGVLTRGAVIKAALRVGLPLLLAKVKGAK